MADYSEPYTEQEIEENRILRLNVEAAQEYGYKLSYRSSRDTEWLCPECFCHTTSPMLHQIWHTSLRPGLFA